MRHIEFMQTHCVKFAKTSCFMNVSTTVAVELRSYSSKFISAASNESITTRQLQELRLTIGRVTTQSNQDAKQILRYQLTIE